MKTRPARPTSAGCPKARRPWPMSPALGLVALAGLGGCFGKSPQTRYYLLEYVPTPPKKIVERERYPVRLRIKDFDVADAYKRSDLVYRQSAHEMEFYDYHQWAVRPEKLISDMVFKHIKAANLFKGITRNLVDYRPDYTLSGEVMAIEEYDSKEKWFAHLAVNFYMEDELSRKLVWQKAYDVRKAVAQNEPVYVVRELSYLLEHVMDKVVEDLDSYLHKAHSGDGGVP